MHSVMIQVVNRALDIMEYIAKDRTRDHPLSEIADHLGLHHATCANIIKTLVTRGYLQKMDKRRGYRLGRMVCHLAGKYSYKKELLTAAAGPMKRLRKDINEGCILTILRDDHRIIIHEEKSFQELQVHNYKEKRAYDTSTGRLILAYLPVEEQIRFIEKYGLPDPKIWPTVEDKEDLLNELRRIRKKEIAKQVSAAHIVGLAAPVFINEQLVAALGVYLPETRYRSAVQDEIKEKLQSTAGEISQRLQTLIPLSKHTTAQ